MHRESIICALSSDAFLITNIQWHSLRIIQPHFRRTTFGPHSESSFTCIMRVMHSDESALRMHSKRNGIQHAFRCDAFKLHSVIIQSMYHSWIAAFMHHSENESFMNCCIHMRCITGLLHSVCTALYAHYKSFIAFCYICIHNAFAYAFMEGCIIIH